ncbi:MAG: hypothetical protein PHW62_04460, partial [Candidatus Ratteibacteria bacterium]|nr:hypothetical protein [Candidatus Ratteibacteria bacterium]
NEGGGVLSGTIAADKPWVKLSETIISASDYQEIEITIDTTSLFPGFSDSALIEIETDGGQETISVDVSMELSFAIPIFNCMKSFCQSLWTKVLASTLIFALFLVWISSLGNRSPTVNEFVEPKTIVQAPVIEKTPIPKAEIVELPKPKLKEEKQAKAIVEPFVEPYKYGNELAGYTEPICRYREPDRVIVYSEPVPVYNRYENVPSRIVFTPNPQIVYYDNSFYAPPEMQFQNNARENDFLVPLIINLLLASENNQRCQYENRHYGGHRHR